MKCAICGKREATGFTDLDPGDPESGPRPEIIEVCSECGVDPEAAMIRTQEEYQREEGTFSLEVGDRAYWFAIQEEMEADLRAFEEEKEGAR
jgi:hypothetical protein